MLLLYQPHTAAAWSRPLTLAHSPTESHTDSHTLIQGHTSSNRLTQSHTRSISVQCQYTVNTISMLSQYSVSTLSTEIGFRKASCAPKCMRNGFGETYTEVVFALLCIALLCFALICFALLCFDLLFFALIAMHFFALLAIRGNRECPDSGGTGWEPHSGGTAWGVDHCPVS